MIRIHGWPSGHSAWRRLHALRCRIGPSVRKNGSGVGRQRPRTSHSIHKGRIGSRPVHAIIRRCSHWTGWRPSHWHIRLGVHGLGTVLHRRLCVIACSRRSARRGTTEDVGIGSISLAMALGRGPLVRGSRSIEPILLAVICHTQWKGYRANITGVRLREIRVECLRKCAG
jgi:hypothetical protein